MLSRDIARMSAASKSKAAQSTKLEKRREERDSALKNVEMQEEELAAIEAIFGEAYQRA